MRFDQLICTLDPEIYFPFSISSAVHPPTAGQYFYPFLRVLFDTSNQETGFGRLPTFAGKRTVFEESAEKRAVLVKYENLRTKSRSPRNGLGMFGRSLCESL